MKKRIVLWGADKDDKKILLALELLDKENKVNLYTFPEVVATELFYNMMMEQWREGRDLDFPENHQLVERNLSIAEDLLPEDIKVDRTDLINRAKTEWHFVVLSSRLYQMYKSELDDIYDRVDQMDEFSEGVWEEIKGFWDKVQSQAKEKNLFREHATALKDKTNEIFNKLKELRKALEKQFRDQSKERAQVFYDKLNTIEEKIEKGLGLKPIFEELKKVQSEFKNGDFARKENRELWNRIDALFKVVKEKRFGSEGEQKKKSQSRIDGRLTGLHGAIDRMEKSIARDRKEMDFQKTRIDRTDGQLEAQIRQAKMMMIEQRIASKDIKLQDMYKTRTELEKKKEVEVKKAAARAEKAEIKEKQKEVKAKIEAEIAEKTKVKDTEADQLKHAAEEINESKNRSKASKAVDNIIDSIEDTIEDAVDTVKAVAAVISDKIEDVIEEVVGDVDTPAAETDSKKETESAPEVTPEEDITSIPIAGTLDLDDNPAASEEE